jgi:PAS domain S-box-containing protein
LSASERRWATTLGSVGDGVIATDIDGRITFLNREAEKLTGWTLNEASNSQFKEVFKIFSEQTRLEAEDPVAKVLKSGLIVGLANNTALLRKDGSEIPIDDSAAPIKDENGNITGVVLVFRDRTERKLTEEKLRENSERLGLMNEKLRVVGSLTRHDVRNKLSTVTGYAYLLKKKHTDQADFVDE